MKKKKNKKIFLDYASITPIDKKVKSKVSEIENKFWGNPSSIHSFGEESNTILLEARKSIALNIHSKPDEIFFTSGGTEGLNLAIFGVIKSFKNKKILPHIIISSIEHSSVLEPVKSLLESGEIEVSFINPDENGIIKPESVCKELKNNTALVIVQHANNEIGTIQPIKKIKNVIENFKKTIKTESLNEFNFATHIRFPYLLVDACQSVLYEDISVERLGAHLLVFDGIKMYGPRGVGVLFVRDGVFIQKIMFGGGQENGLRSGTQNVSGICGLATALEIAKEIRENESKRLIDLRDYFISKITEEFSNISLNGSRNNRLPNNINICIPNTDSEFMVIKLDTMGFAISNASACHNGGFENSSYVIENINKSGCASSSLRITLGRETKKSDLDKLFLAFKKILKG